MKQQICGIIPHPVGLRCVRFSGNNRQEVEERMWKYPDEWIRYQREADGLTARLTYEHRSAMPDCKKENHETSQILNR